MRVILAGSRWIMDGSALRGLISQSGVKIDQIVVAKDTGMDRLAWVYAQNHDLPIRTFLADWDRWGRFAGVQRNEEMVDYADVLLAIWDGMSRGTESMIRTAQDAGLPVYVMKYQTREITYYPPREGVAMDMFTRMGVL